MHDGRLRLLQASLAIPLGLALLFPDLVAAQAAPADAEVGASSVEGERGVSLAEADDVVGPYTRRGLTLPRGQLRVDAGSSERGLNASGIINGPLGMPAGRAAGLRIGRIEIPTALGTFDDTAALWAFGASYGVFDDLEVGATVFPILMAPSGDFGDMMVYGRYAFVMREVVEVGAQLALTFPTQTDLFGMALGVPVSFVVVDALRIETGFELEMLLQSGPDYVGFDVPIALTYNITDTGFAGAHTSLVILDELQGISIPLGVHGGYSLFLPKAVTDLTAGFAFLLADDVALQWEITIGANVHLGVGPS